MSGSKSVFTARDLSPPTYSNHLADHGGAAYAGRERRSQNRRTLQDRRAQIRFDLHSADRRASLGRRAADKAPEFW